MSLLVAASAFIALTTALLGFLLLRAVRTQRAWFLAIDPDRTKNPTLFWYCVAFTVISFVGGLFATAILAIAIAERTSVLVFISYIAAFGLAAILVRDLVRGSTQIGRYRFARRQMSQAYWATVLFYLAGILTLILAGEFKAHRDSRCEPTPEKPCILVFVQQAPK